MSKFKLSAFLLSFILASNAFAGSVIKTIQAGATDQTVVLKIIDSADGTPETGVVFNTSGIDLEYWRHGANTATDITEATQTVNGAHTDGGFVHIGHGMYRLDLPDAAVAAGVTAVEVYGTVTGMIVIGGTVDLSPPVNVISAAGTAWGSGAITAASIATDAIGAAELASDAGTEIGTATWATTTRVLTAATNITAAINAEVDTALADIHLDHLLAADYDPASKPGVSTALFNELIESDSGVSRFTANSLEQAPTGAGGDGSAFTAIPWNPAWDAEVESEVDDALGGSGTGTSLTAIPWNSDWDAQVESEVEDAVGADVTAILADTNELQTDDYPARFTGIEGSTFNTSTDSLEAIRNRGDSAWVTGAGGTGLTALADGTAQAGTSTTIQLASAETFGDDILNGAVVNVLTGTGAGQTRVITDYVGSTDTATVTPAWITNPASDSTYEVWPGSVNVAAWMGAAVTTGLETAADIVDEWETQSQADPTGFHVNVIEVGGTAQTANDNGADINAILVDTAVIGAAGAGLSAIPWNAAWDAQVESEVDDALGGGTGTALTAIPWNASWDTEVQSEANDALVANHLDHLLAADYDPASKPGVSTALLNELVENDSGVSRFTVNALENGPSGSGASAESIADAVWDEATSGHTTAGTFGAQVATDIDAILVDTAVIGAAGAGLTSIPWNSSWDAEVQSEATDALNAYDPPTNTEFEARTLPSGSYFDFTTDEVDIGLINGCTITGDGGASPFDVSCP